MPKESSTALGGRRVGRAARHHPQLCIHPARSHLGHLVRAHTLHSHHTRDHHSPLLHPAHIHIHTQGRAHRLVPASVRGTTTSYGHYRRALRQREVTASERPSRQRTRRWVVVGRSLAAAPSRARPLILVITARRCPVCHRDVTGGRSTRMARLQAPWTGSACRHAGGAPPRGSWMLARVTPLVRQRKSSQSSRVGKMDMCSCHRFKAVPRSASTTMCRDLEYRPMRVTKS